MEQKPRFGETPPPNFEEQTMSAKLPIDRPCSACSAGDVQMEYHDHQPPFRESAPVEPSSKTLTFTRNDDNRSVQEVEIDRARFFDAAEPSAGMSPEEFYHKVYDGDVECLLKRCTAWLRPAVTKKLWAFALAYHEYRVKEQNND